MDQAIKDLIRVREANENDLNFILNSWLQSNKKLRYRRVANKFYYSYYRDFVLNCLSRSTVLIACNVDESNLIYGWLAFEGDTLHYMYVKKPYRKHGISKLLRGKCDCSISSIKCMGYDYNPFKFFREG